MTTNVKHSGSSISYLLPMDNSIKKDNKIRKQEESCIFETDNINSVELYCDITNILNQHLPTFL